MAKKKEAKKEVAHPKIRRRLNGFLIYEDGERCLHCSAEQKLDPKHPADPAGYVLTCPTCYRNGCEECMPMGRGCNCPECEGER